MSMDFRGPEWKIYDPDGVIPSNTRKTEGALYSSFIYSGIVRLVRGSGSGRNGSHPGHSIRPSHDIGRIGSSVGGPV